jgi:hypothetical protein
VKSVKCHLHLLHLPPVQAGVQANPAETEVAIIGHHVMIVNVNEGMIDMHRDMSEFVGRP